MTKIVFLRHGQSLWNESGMFTGWTDIDLSTQGREEAAEASKRLKEGGFTFDIVFTSVLRRAIHTSWIVMDGMDLMWVPIICSWRLNERHYGALQGLSKKEMAKKYGQEQVHDWRRSYNVKPPPLSLSDPRHPRFDPRYKKLMSDLLPSAESLKDTLDRTIPYWAAEILPRVKEGLQILVSAHGNSIRALIKHLDRVSDEAISEINIPTGIPLVYELEEGTVVGHHYLASTEELTKAMKRAAKVR